MESHVTFNNASIIKYFSFISNHDTQTWNISYKAYVLSAFLCSTLCPLSMVLDSKLVFLPVIWPVSIGKEYIYICICMYLYIWASQVALVVKNPPAHAGAIREMDWIPRSGGSLEEGNPLQYSCLENPMDRGAWRATVHRVEKSLTQLKRLSMHACTDSHTPIHMTWRCPCS